MNTKKPGTPMLLRELTREKITKNKTENFLKPLNLLKTLSKKDLNMLTTPSLPSTD